MSSAQRLAGCSDPARLTICYLVFDDGCHGLIHRDPTETVEVADVAGGKWQIIGSADRSDHGIHGRSGASGLGRSGRIKCLPRLCRTAGCTRVARPS